MLKRAIERSAHENQAFVNKKLSGITEGMELMDIKMASLEQRITELQGTQHKRQQDMEKLVKQLPDDFEVRLEMFEERILQSIEAQTMRLIPYHIDMDDSQIDDLNNRTQNSAPDKDMSGANSRNV